MDCVGKAGSYHKRRQALVAAVTEVIDCYGLLSAAFLMLNDGYLQDLLPFITGDQQLPAEIC